MKQFFVEIFSVLIGITFIFGNLTSANAQEGRTPEFTLEEITVTAQKREENQQKVAVAIDVISGDQIKELGQNDIDQILSNVSGIIINKAKDGFRVAIRGISNDSGIPAGDIQSSTPTVGVNKDGVYTNRNNGAMDLYDVERVEVMYGPQSTLYASASPGGIVNILTTNPKADKYEASGTLEYGNYNLLHTEGMVNAPISGSLAFRAAFSTSVHDGYLSNGSDDEDTKSARLRTLYKPTDNFSLIITGEISKVGGHGFSAVKSFVDQDDTDNPWTASSDDAGTPRNELQRSLYGHVDWTFANIGTLSIMPSYSKSGRTTSQTSTGGFMGPDAVTESDRVSSGFEKGMEIRMVSSGDSFFKWLLGFNWYKSLDQAVTDSLVTVNNTTSSTYDYTYSLIKSHAFYGNVTYPITDRFRVTAGMRESWEKNYTHTYSEPGRGNESYHLEVTSMNYSNPDYKLGMEYDLSGQSMLYLDWSTSYRTHGGALVDANGDPFPPEKLKAYSLGAKSRFFGNRLQVNGSAFYYDYNNYMAITMMGTVYDANGNGVRDADENDFDQDDGAKQVGDARVYGLDLQTSSILSDEDKLDVSVSYLKKYFTHLFFDYFDITNSMGMPDLDYSGKEMTNSPHWTISASYSHNFLLPNGGTLTGRIDTRYQSAYRCAWRDTILSFNSDFTEVTTEYLGKTIIQEPHEITNLSLIYTHPDGKWTFSGYVKNLENYAEKRSVIDSNMIIGSPRTYGAILSVKF